MSKKIRVVGIGALNLDLIVRYSDRDSKAHQIMLDPSRGEARVPSRDKLMEFFYSAASYRMVVTSAGGSAFNTISALKAIDPLLEVHYVSAIGMDVEATVIRNDPNWERIDGTNHVQRIKGNTGMCVSLVAGARLERILKVETGVNSDFSAAGVDRNLLTTADWIHISPFFDDHCNRSIAELLVEIREAGSTRPVVSLDPGDILSMAGMENEVVQELLHNVDFLLLKHDELMSLAGLEGLWDEQVERSEAVHRIFEKFKIMNIIVERGLDRFFIHKNGERRPIPIWLPSPANNKPFRIVDDTGAGDVFDAGFIYGQLKQFTDIQTAWLIADIERIHLSHLGSCGYNAFKWAAPTAFMSHSSADKFLVSTMCEELNSKNIGIWLDTHDIDAGDDLQFRVAQGIRECDTFVLCLSKDSIKSPWVHNEIELAKSQYDSTGLKPRLIAAIIKYVDPKDIKRLELNNWTFLDLTSDANIRKSTLTLVRTLRKPLESAEANCRCRQLTEVIKTGPRNLHA